MDQYASFVPGSLEEQYQLYQYLLAGYIPQNVIPTFGRDYYNFQLQGEAVRETRVVHNVQYVQNEGFSNFAKQQETCVRLYRDANYSQLIPEYERINKDLIYYFLLPDVFPSTKAFTVDIDDSIYRKDRRHTPVQPNSQNFGDLCATVIDDDNTTMNPCHACSTKQSQMISIRSASQHGTNLIVCASINCSGNPTSSARNLRVQFMIRNYGRVSAQSVWKETTTRFKLYHSRKRLKEDSTNSISEEVHFQEQPLVRQHRLLAPSWKVPPTLIRDYAHPAVGELYSHMAEVLSADSGTNLSEPGLHVAFLLAGRSLRTTPQLDTSGTVFRFLLPHFLEFTMGVSELCRLCLTQGDEDSFHFNVSKLKENSQLMLATHPAEWTEMLRLYWECSRTSEFEWCYCDSCLYSHLSFLVHQARNIIGLSKPKIADLLNEKNIPTRQRKKWHSSLTGIQNKVQYYVWGSKQMPKHWHSVLELTSELVPQEKIMGGYRKLARILHGDPDFLLGQDKPELSKFLKETHGVELDQLALEFSQMMN